MISEIKASTGAVAGEALGVEMAKTSPLDREELALEYDDPAWKSKFFEAIDLVTLLRESIIGKNYRPSEKLNNAIMPALTPYGKNVRDQLIKKEEVNAKDANILTFLALVHIHPLIDFNQLDFSKLEDAISEEIRAEKIRYPMRFGRELYDSAAELFKEERSYLRHEETLRLLAKQDKQGVFQAGKYLVGPYGMFVLPHTRRINPTVRVPLQHCADSTCSIVHRLTLTTSFEAGVNAGRKNLNAVLDDTGSEASDWNGYISDILEEEENPYRLQTYLTVPYLLGDCFSEKELQILMTTAIRSGTGVVPQKAKSLGLTLRNSQIVETLRRSESMQLLLTETDETLVTIIDASIESGAIEIPQNEVRRPVVNSQASSGAWRLRPQVGSRGVRSRAASSALPLQWLASIVDNLYDVNSNEEMEDLAWVLRHSDGNTSREKLAHFLRTAEPRVVVEKLILARKKNVSAIEAEIGVSMSGSDNDFAETVLWKLGFPLDRVDDLRNRYWSEHDSLEALTATAQAKVDHPENTIRAASSNYFVALEEFLFDSLNFACWALLADHFDTDRPFVYFKDRAREFTIARLNDFAGEENADLKLNDSPVLAQIVTGYHSLSKLLESLTEESSQFRRKEEDIPKWCAKTPIQKFPFMHTSSFLDLVPEAQRALINGLQKVGALVGDSGIMSARNGLLHARKQVPTQAELNASLVKSREALSHLEELGCVRATYRRVSTNSDKWGRRTVVLVANGRSIDLISPSSFEWLRLPKLSEPQYLFHGARFAPPNEMLRFTEGHSSEFSDYWSGFPIRPERGSRVVEEQNDGLIDTLGSDDLSRAR